MNQPREKPPTISKDRRQQLVYCILTSAAGYYDEFMDGNDLNAEEWLRTLRAAVENWRTEDDEAY